MALLFVPRRSRRSFLLFKIRSQWECTGSCSLMESALPAFGQILSPRTDMNQLSDKLQSPTTELSVLARQATQFLHAAKASSTRQ